MSDRSTILFFCTMVMGFPLVFSAFPMESPVSTPAAARADSGLTDNQEQQFQDDLNDFFPETTDVIDTTGWCTSKINRPWFDYRRMEDTVRIALFSASSCNGFSFPFKNYVTSQFGPRNGFWHFGVDIKVARGDSIRCALDGIVRVIENDRHGYGKVVVVRHHNGLETLYGHLSRVFVTGNQKVASAQVIGLGGNTGRSTGSHLHFEMRYRGEPFDPNCIVDFDRQELRGDTLALSRQNFDYLTAVRQTVYHSIHAGETLGGLARKYGTTIGKLCALNRLTPRTVLRIGRKLIIRKWDEPPAEEAGDKTQDGRILEKTETKTAKGPSAL
jgi:hypothetical protein